jgi:hypothetical protein
MRCNRHHARQRIQKQKPVNLTLIVQSRVELDEQLSALRCTLSSILADLYQDRLYMVSNRVADQAHLQNPIRKVRRQGKGGKHLDSVAAELAEVCTIKIAAQ